MVWLRIADVNAIVALRRKGFSLRGIRRLSDHSRQTVRKYLDPPDGRPGRRPRLAPPSKLEPFKTYLEERLQAPGWTAKALLSEVQHRGYHGSYATLRRYLRPHRARVRQQEFEWMLAVLQGALPYAAVIRQLGNLPGLENLLTCLREGRRRLPKQLHSLYATAAPPVQGGLCVWSFPSAQHEAAAIAQSCQQLINAGMVGQEDQILILISNRRLQLGPITQELANLGLPFDPPGGQAVRDEEGIRAAYSILRIVRDRAANKPDYVAHRALVAQLHGVGPNTGRALGDLCVTNLQNFREMFYLPATPRWLTGRSAAAVGRIRTIIEEVAGWTLQDTIRSRGADIAQVLSNVVFSGSAQGGNHIGTWNGFAASLPPDMILEEVLGFLAADDEAEQRQILEAVNDRLGGAEAEAVPPQRRIRILTMHGAKGLSGKAVFIPSAEQGIMPSFRAIHAAGLLNEQRRLFHVSLTRAKAACIVSHAALHAGAAAFLIQQRPEVMLPRSQFLNEMGVVSVNRNGGLTAAEAAQVMADVNNL